MPELNSSKWITGKRLATAGAIVMAFLLGMWWRGAGDGTDTSSTSETATAQMWTCAMHPQIQLPEFGQCPLCFMDLIPVQSDAGQELDSRTLVLSPAAAALAEIQTVRVERRHVPVDIRLVGTVEFDESRYRTISAWVAGRLDTLFVNTTGERVRRGQALASLYSPELYAAQAELQNALSTTRQLQGDRDGIMARTAHATVEASRERLRQWGLTAAQIARIEAGDIATDHLRIASPLSGVVVHKSASEGQYVQTGSHLYSVADLSRVWVALEAYESDLIWLQTGQTITFAVKALPGHAFSGEIVFIDPVLDPTTRTVTVRLEADNDEELLKPGMFVQAVAAAGRARSGQGDAALAEAPPPLVIPASAPLLTGKRAIVYVRLPGQNQPTFEGREVVLGPRAGDYYLVKDGLVEGEEVVVKGNFKIDSALQIQARPSMMLPAATQAAEMLHEDIPEEPATSVLPLNLSQVPDSFRHQLGQVLDGYLQIQVALAKDDDKTALAAATRTGDALQQVDSDLLEAPIRSAWSRENDILVTQLTAVSKAKNITSRRAAFMGLSDNLWRTLQRFGYHGPPTVRLFHCPMANENAGADWLQLETVTANPYYGASMLRCGSQKDSLTVQSAHQEGHQ